MSATIQTPNYELLKDAYAIIDGIPAKHFDLEAIVDKVGESLTCGTVACAIGWLGLHPKFNELGLQTVLGKSDDSYLLKMNGFHDDDFYSHKVAGLFGISVHDASDLFGPASHSGFDYLINSKTSDKKRFLKRVKLYLIEKGQL